MIYAFRLVSLKRSLQNLTAELRRGAASPKQPATLALFSDRRRFSKSAISAPELDLRLAEPNEIRRRGGNRAIDGEHRDFEFVAGVDGVPEHQPVGHVEPL